jgi:hypothetical protein
MHNTFARRHALAEIAGAFPQGAALNPVDDATSRYLMQESGGPLTSIAGEEARYSTHELLARERKLIYGAQRRPSHGRTHDRRKDRPGDSTSSRSCRAGAHEGHRRWRPRPARIHRGRRMARRAHPPTRRAGVTRGHATAHPGEQRALQALRDGDPDSYLQHKQDKITVHETEIDALTTLTGAWHDAQLRLGRREAVMIARDNLTRERLNHAARAKLKTQPAARRA